MTDQNASDRSFGEVTENPDNVQDSDNNEQVNTESTETTLTDTTGDNVQTEESPATENTETVTEESQLTEKGTKLDPNPQSAVHQQLANERRAREQMQQLLSNPQMLSQYMKQQFPEPAKGEESVTKEYSPKDFETLDDVAKVVNSLQKGFEDKSKTYEEKIAQLNSVIETIATQTKQQQLANNIKYEVESVKSLPEFDKNSPDYVEGLEQRILTKFHELDFDPNTGFYKGQYSLQQLVQDAIDNIKLGRQSGSLKAQTIVKNKVEGKIKTSPKVDVGVNDDALSPEDSIGRGIAKMFGKN